MIIEPMLSLDLRERTPLRARYTGQGRHDVIECRCFQLSTVAGSALRANNSTHCGCVECLFFSGRYVGTCWFAMATDPGCVRAWHSGRHLLTTQSQGDILIVSEHIPWIVSLLYGGQAWVGVTECLFGKSFVFTVSWEVEIDAVSVTEAL